MTIVEQGLLAAEPQSQDKSFDKALRPKTLAQYIGQDTVTEQMGIFLAAARQLGEPLDHCLIFGPPGLGKTTLAYIIASEMGAHLHTTSGPMLEKAG